MLDDGLDDIELRIVCGAGVRGSTILEEQVLCLLTLMDDKSHITPIVNNQVSSATLTVILRSYQGIQDAVPVTINTLAISGKHRSIFITCNDRHSMVLGGKNVARAPTEVTADSLESLNQH